MMLLYAVRHKYDLTWMPRLRRDSNRRFVDKTNWPKQANQGRFFEKVWQAKKSISWLVPSSDYEIVVFQLEYLSIYEEYPHAPTKTPVSIHS